MSTLSPTINSQLIVQDKREQGVTVYNFGLGANPFPPHTSLLKRFKDSCHMKNYTYPYGDDGLRQIVKNHYTTPSYIVKQILVGNGLKELLFIIQMVFKGTIIHVAPAWVSYMEQTKMLGKSVITIKGDFDNNCKLTPETLDMVLSERCGPGDDDKVLLVFNSPNNPTGISYSKTELQELGDVINKYGEKVVVFSDEIYKNFVHDGSLGISISKYVPNTICGSSLSKEAACGGWRMAWITFPESLTYIYNDAYKAISTIYSCVSQPLIEVTKEYLTNIDNFLYIRYMNKIFSQAVNQVRGILMENSMVEIIPANGAWYLFLCAEKYRDKLNQHNIMDGEQLCERILQDISVVAVAGEHFGYHGYYLRLSCVDFATYTDGNISTDETHAIRHMRNGAHNLATWFEEL